jgi:hypothetical protein
MGWGDEIMLTADVRRLQLKDPRKVAVRGKMGEARWHEIWANNPRMAVPMEVRLGRTPVQWLHNCGGHRPYLDYARFPNRDTYAFREDFRAEPGEIYLTPAERAWAAGQGLQGAIIIEPTIKPGAPVNKAWIESRWGELARILEPIAPLVQLGSESAATLRGCRRVVTRNTREAAAAVSAASLVITVEGGLHHCAAAFGIRAVVLFGGYISPATTGYDMHVNLFTGGKACGSRKPCQHCREAMAAITVDQVAEHAIAQLEALKAVAC